MKIIRDLFFHCAQSARGGVTTSELMTIINAKTNHARKSSENQLEKNPLKSENSFKGMARDYLHATRYLGLVERRKNGKWYPNLDKHPRAKELLLSALEESRSDKRVKKIDRNELSFREKLAFQEILWDYHHVRIFTWWYMDFSSYPDPYTISLKDFREEGGAIGLLSRKHEIYWWRSIDDSTWKVPRRYHRLSVVTHLYPQWLRQVGVIDRCPLPGRHIASGSNTTDQWWIGYYPLAGELTSHKLLARAIDDYLVNFSSKYHGKRHVTVWIPELLWNLVLALRQPLDSVKKGLQLLVKENPNRYYLERTSIDVMSKQTRFYEESYLIVDGMYRSTLLMTVT